MSDLTFVRETSNMHKVRSLIITSSIIIFLVAMAILLSTIWAGVFHKLPGIELLPSLSLSEFKQMTPGLLFYAEFAGGIFFVPTPDELFFYYALVRGNSVILCIFLSVFGYMLAQFINYWAGTKISKPLLHLISKRKLYETRRFTNKYGSLGIFLSNLLPLPAPLLTFALAITNYNFNRLMLWTLLGKIAKYILIAAFFLLTTHL